MLRSLAVQLARPCLDRTARGPPNAKSLSTLPDKPTQQDTAASGRGFIFDKGPKLCRQWPPLYSGRLCRKW